MKINLLITAILAGFATSSVAGEKVGNGGGAWVCQDAEGKVTSIELYDFHQSASAIPRNRSSSYRDQLSESVSELRNRRIYGIGREFLETALAIDAAKILLKPGERLGNTGDHGLPQIYRLKPEGCGFEQFATYIHEQLYVVGDFWNSPLLTDTDRAGLLAHETLYREARRIDRKTADSVGVRPVVAGLFNPVENSEKLQAGLLAVLTTEKTTRVRISDRLDAGDRFFLTFTNGFTGAALVDTFVSEDLPSVGSRRFPATHANCKKTEKDSVARRLCLPAERARELSISRYAEPLRTEDLLGRSIRMCTVNFFDDRELGKLWLSPLDGSEPIRPAAKVAYELRASSNERLGACAIYSFY